MTQCPVMDDHLLSQSHQAGSCTQICPISVFQTTISKQTYLFCKKEMSIFSGSRYYRPCFLGYNDRNLSIEMSNTPAYLWCDNYLKMCLPSPSLGWRVCRVPVCHHQKFLMVMVKLPAGGTTMRDARATLDLAGLCQQVCNTLQYNYHTSYQPSLEASV